MRTLVRYASSIGTAAALLAGCGGSQPPISAPVAMPQSHAIATHDRGGSWMLPEAKKIKQLLYVDDARDGQVYVFNYKTNGLVGTLAGFDHPTAQCVDAAGDIYITNFDGWNVVEYAHGGVTPIKTLDTDGFANGCSIDPTTGNLAVATFDSASGGGNIEVWKSASGSPTNYFSPDTYNLWPPGYDNKGNLFVEGQCVRGCVNELPAGGAALIPVSIHHVIDSPGTVMWDGKYITFADQGGHKTRLYQVVETRSGQLGVVGITVLTDTCKGKSADVGQPFIVGKRNTPENKDQGITVIGNNADCSGRFDFWAYPAGGKPSKKLPPVTNISEGESVSIAR
jgi:hypothetical protein